MRPSRRDLLHALPLSLLHASPPPGAALRQLWLRAPFENLFLPRTRWPWPAPPPSPPSITSQLEALHSIGIGGVEIVPSSPGFLEAARHAVSEATRLDMKLSLPLLLDATPPAHILNIAALDLHGPFQYEGPLPFSPSAGPTVAVVGARLSGNTLDSLTDLTDDFTGDAGRWRVEDGLWRLMAFRLTATSFIDPSATRRAVEPAIRDILLAFGPMLGRTVDSLFIPPPPNAFLWAPGTLAEFRRRRGYDLTPLLPALFFDIGPRTAAIRADVRTLVSTLVEERYYQPIREACRRILVHPRTDSPTLDGNTLEALQRNAAALLHAGVTRFYHPQPPTLPHYRSLAACLARTSALLRQGNPAAAPSMEGLLVSRRVLDNGVELFFVSNPGSTRTVFSYSAEGKWFEVWDPATGSITTPAHPAEIQPAQSLFAVFHPGRHKPRRFFFGFPSRFFRRRASME